MAAATWCLFAMGLLGACDILFFHVLGQSLRCNHDSRRELVTHVVRDMIYATLFLVVPNVAFHGAAYALFALLVVFDIGISIADFTLEKESRKRMGGLPTGEYLLHIALAVLYGAMLASIIDATVPVWLHAPTAIRFEPAAVPAALRAALAAMAVGALAAGMQDFLAVRRLMRTDVRRSEERRSFAAF